MSLKSHIEKLGNLDHYDYPDLEPLDQDWRWCHKYAHNIITGKIPACKKMKWAALRHFQDLQRDDLFFDEDAAKSIVLWFSFCPITDGKLAGKPTILDPSQIFLAASLIGWKWGRTSYDDDGNALTVAGERRFTQAFMLVSRKYGKALALDTPIPTPTGWSTMGDLMVGDKVFDENGSPCNVIGVTEVQHNRTCYRMTFSNGEDVIADVDHQWFTKARSDNGVGSVKTTQQIVDSMTYGVRGDLNHHMDMPEHLKCDNVDLPFDPYLLGYWLGDGSSDGTRIACGDEDVAHLTNHIESLGYSFTVKQTRTVKMVTPIAMQKNGKRVCVRSPEHLKKKLLTLNVIGNKHIPDLYKRASYSQRLALVQGLMDSDGTINKRGNQITFNQNSGQLFDDFCEMVASLGIKYSIRDKFNKRFNSVSRECGFNTFRDEHKVFKLPRKLDRMNLISEANAKPRSKTVSIVSCELVESVPVKCISVDSPNKLYRFGKTMLPTHNTTFIAGIKLYLMYKYGHRPRCFSLATKRDQAKEVWLTACEMVRLSPRLRTIFEPRANDMLYPKKSGFFKPLASDSNSLDGLNPMAAVLDECHAIKDRNLYGVIVSAFGAQTEFLMSVITTAGFILDGLCTDLYKNAARVLDPDDDITQDNYFYAVFEIDEHDDWTEPRNWYKSNPALVYGRPSMKYLRERFQEAQMSVEEKGNFLTKHCNKFVNGSDKWLDLDLFKEGAVKDEWDRWKHLPCGIGFDRSQTSDITSATVNFPTEDGGLMTFTFNLQSQGAVNDAGDYLRQIYNKAADEGDLTILPGSHIRNESVKQLIRELWSELSNCEACYYDPYKMKEVALDLEEEGITMVSVSMGPGNVSEPAKKFEGLVNDGLYKYNQSTLLEYAVSCAMVQVSKFGNTMVYRDPAAHKTDRIDPLITIILALSGLTLTKVEKNIYESRGLLSI